MQCFNFPEWYKKSHGLNGRILTLITAWPSHLSHVRCWTSLSRKTPLEEECARKWECHTAPAAFRSRSSQSVQRGPHEILQCPKRRSRKIERDREQLSKSIRNSAGGTGVGEKEACSCNTIPEPRVQLSQSNREVAGARACSYSGLHWISGYSWDSEENRSQRQCKHWHNLARRKWHERGTRKPGGEDKKFRAGAL